MSTLCILQIAERSQFFLCYFSAMRFGQSASRGIPRNAPCPCKSGKRYKHCHGAFGSDIPDDIPEAEVREQLRRQEAAEMLRRRQQGYGRPIVSTERDGYRFVVVGNRLSYSRRWRFFPEFLIANMKRVMGIDAGLISEETMPDYPLFRWLRALKEARLKLARTGPISATGGLSALSRFAYALYLIEHNDKPPKSLIKRLQKVNDFDPACYEVLVSSYFALAGASIDGAEDGSGGGSRPEFYATIMGKTFAVEAKRKRGWKTAYNLDSEDFRAELRSWLRNKLYESSKKELTNPVYWFELGIGHAMKEPEVRRLGQLVDEAIDAAMGITVKGEKPSPAYVVVTNSAEFANDDVPNVVQFALFFQFHMEDPTPRAMSLEEAMARHDKHRPIRHVLQAMVSVQMLPNSFAGVPDELLDQDGNAIETLRIGQRIVYPKADGSEGVGTITEVAALGDRATAVVFDEVEKTRTIVGVPLTPQEVKAVERLGNAIFGKPEGPHENITEPMRWYDRMLEIFADYSHESLMTEIGKHPLRNEFAKLSRDELHVRVAREATKARKWQSSELEAEKSSSSTSTGA